MSVEAACAHTAVRCLATVARHHGIDTSPERLIHDFVLGNEEPQEPFLVRMAREIGLKAKAVTLGWDDLFGLNDAFPVILRLRNGNSMLLVGGATRAGTRLALLQDPLAEDAGVLMLDEARLMGAWDGHAVFLKKQHGKDGEERPFNLLWFLPEILRQVRIFRDIGIASILLTALAMAMPVFTQLVIDKVLVHHSLGTLYVLVGGMVFVILFETVFSYLRQYMVLFATNKIDARINTKVFNKLISLPIDFFERSSAGIILKNMYQTDRIRGFLTGQVFMTMLDAAALLVFIPLLFFYSPVLAAIVMVFTLLICVSAASTIPIIRRRLTSVYETEARQQSFLVENIQGMRTVKSLALDARQRKLWDARVAQTVTVRFNVAKLVILLQALTGPLEKLMFMTVMGVGAYLVLEGEMMIGALIAFNIITGRVTGPLIQLTQLIQQFQEVSLSVAMLGTIMNEKSEQGRTGRGLRTPFKGRVEFQNIRFRYNPGSSPALDDVTFTVPEGTIFGIMGRSGSGKTTVTRLLQGLHNPQEGLIKIDGHDLREIDLDHLRSNIGVVLQENFLFRGSIRENIAAGKPNASMEEIMRAARLAGADEFIERLPRGFDTMLEEGSANLSGGQRQRLAIARALLRDPPILILDEATSALDAESEAIVQANLMSIAQGRTLIIISHRLSSLVPANAIMVLERGKAVDMGRHHELLDRCDIYQHLWNQQNRHVKGVAA
ncbi:peptidase domain-containing ABC transporter [Azospirillum sp.]|uniref:peptidase domain-containing ABC transporter n=1 Tax=Azospirillum sp. TaxID=34012 RepID=UPI003D75269F